MFYVTGDTHGSIDIHKLTTRLFPQGENLTKDDYLIICGDFGLVWNNSKDELYWRKWLNSKPWTTLFVDGNHENHPLLNSYLIEEKWGGKVHKIQDNIYHLMRGQVFEIDGKKLFTMGGALSHDKKWRTPGKTWWSEELPSQNEFNEAIDNLTKHNWNVDYVITHCAPTEFQKCICKYYKPDRLTEFLQYIDEKLKYKAWFMGHYHRNETFGNKHILYNHIDKL